VRFWALSLARAEDTVGTASFWLNTDRPAEQRSLGRRRHPRYRGLPYPTHLPGHVRHRFRYEPRAGLHHRGAQKERRDRRHDLVSGGPLRGARQPLHHGWPGHAGKPRLRPRRIALDQHHPAGRRSRVPWAALCITAKFGRRRQLWVLLTN
jgi:hypothetical protein